MELGRIEGRIKDVEVELMEVGPEYGEVVKEEKEVKRRCVLVWL